MAPAVLLGGVTCPSAVRVVDGVVFAVTSTRDMTQPNAFILQRVTLSSGASTALSFAGPTYSIPIASTASANGDIQTINIPVRPTSLEAYELAMTPDGNRAEFAIRAHYVESGTKITFSQEPCTVDLDIIEYGLYAVDVRTATRRTRRARSRCSRGRRTPASRARPAPSTSRTAMARLRPAIVPRDWRPRSGHEEDESYLVALLVLSFGLAHADARRRVAVLEYRSGAAARGRRVELAKLLRDTAALDVIDAQAARRKLGPKSTARSRAVPARPCASAPSVSSWARKRVLLVGVSQFGDVIDFAAAHRREKGQAGARLDQSLPPDSEVSDEQALTWLRQLFPPEGSSVADGSIAIVADESGAAVTLNNEAAGKTPLKEPLKVRAPGTSRAQGVEGRLLAVRGARRRLAR